MAPLPQLFLYNHGDSSFPLQWGTKHFILLRQNKNKMHDCSKLYNAECSSSDLSIFGVSIEFVSYSGIQFPSNYYYYTEVNPVQGDC